MAGARAVRQSVIAHPSGADIDVHVVWSDIRATDDLQAATRLAREMDGERVRHYWDPEVSIGTALGTIVPIGDAPFAWDVYLFFGGDARWSREPPRPETWGHQLAGADAESFHGGRIDRFLHREMERRFGTADPSSDPAVESEPVDTSTILTIDVSRERTLAELLLDDVLDELGADLPDELAGRIRERFGQRADGYRGQLPIAIRLDGEILVLPEVDCLPTPPTDGATARPRATPRAATADEPVHR